MHNDFNGMQELITRAEGYKALLNMYQKMDPSDYPQNAEPAVLGEFAKKFTYIEVIMAYNPIRDKFTREEKVLLLETTIRVLEKKRKEKKSPCSVAPTLLRIFF